MESTITQNSALYLAQRARQGRARPRSVRPAPVVILRPSLHKPHEEERRGIMALFRRSRHSVA